MKTKLDLCGQHRWEWKRWAGEIDVEGNPTGGWGPHNPIPYGVTVGLAAQQRLDIRRACTDGKGCSDNYGPRP